MESADDLRNLRRILRTGWVPARLPYPRLSNASFLRDYLLHPVFEHAAPS
jgi:hypothetical protein